jgi:pimeloyl-ACP methyl ester carboxylesterase
MKIKANGIQIEVEDTGADGSQNDRPVVLLIMGLGMQLIAWPPALVQGLVDAGFRVIRHDNSDIGLSQHFDHLGVPNLVWATLQHRLGLSPKAPFTLSDMAADAVGVLDALKIERAHIVGVSMGGMIAQRVAIAAPKRVLSLTSIMSSSGARGLPRAKPQSQLGKASAYVDQYDPRCCFPSRARASGPRSALPGRGTLFWGRPVDGVRAVVAEPARQAAGGAGAHHRALRNAQHRREQVFKLYLNSFNNTRFADAAKCRHACAPTSAKPCGAVPTAPPPWA